MAECKRLINSLCVNVVVGEITCMMGVIVALMTLALSPYPAVAQGIQYNVTEFECETEWTLMCIVKAMRGWEGTSQVRIAFNYIDEQHFYYVKVAPWGISIVKASPAGEKNISITAQTYRPRKSELTVIVKRRQLKITVIVNDNVVAWAYDGEYREGRIATAMMPQGAFKIDKLRLQPVEAIYYADDFTRTAQEPSAIKFVSGNWKPTGLGAPKGNPNYKANAFALHAGAEREGLAVMGYWFWDNYEATVAVRPVRAEAVGLCVFYQDPNNYILLRWSNVLSNNDGRCDLIRVTDGKRTVLASARIGFATEQWYKIGLRATDDKIVAIIDSVPVASAKSLAFGQGQVALYVERSAEVYFDDVEVKTWHHFEDDFAHTTLGKWQVWNGKWNVESGALCGRGSNSYIATGAAEWTDYEVSVQVRAKDGSAGIAFLCQDEKNHYLLQCTPRAGKVLVSLARVEEGKVHVLAMNTMKNWSRTKVHQLRVVAPWYGGLHGYVDNQLLVQATDTQFRSGGIALYCNGSAAFDDLRVQFREEAYREPPVAPQFLTEKLMQLWATSRGMWHTQGSDRGAVFWHHGIFYGETDVAFDWVRVPTFIKQFEVSFGAMRDDFDSGVRFLIERGQHPYEMKLSIMQGERRIAERQWQVNTKPGSIPVRIIVARRCIVGMIGDQPVIEATLSMPPPGHRLALRVDRLPFDITLVGVRSSNVLDTTFGHAPVEFYAQRGRWDITPRWPCQLDWSWFGGLDDRVPLLWSKVKYHGNLVIEFYGNIGMDLPKEPGYSRPSDINITFCADGMNLNSGYSFIYSGWDSTRSALLKGDAILADSTKHHFINPHNHNFAFHQRWFYIRIEKVGQRIRCYVLSPETGDEALVCEATDSKPLNEGYIALWTYHNILLIARLRIWYQEDVESLDYLAGLKSLAMARQMQRQFGEASRVPTDPNNDFERGLDGWAPLTNSNGVILTRDSHTAAHGHYSLKVTNAISGGHFAVRVFTKQLDLMQRPRLRFSYKIPPNVKINVYFKRGDAWYALVLTGSDEPPMDLLIKVLGRVPNVKADNRWHHAEFNLLQAFRELEPKAKDYVVEEIVIGELNDPPYLQAGFKGNPAGAYYYIDNFVIE